MTSRSIVSREEWLEARKALLAKEKAFTRTRDALSAERRALPMVKVDQAYTFHTVDGEKTLNGLFGTKSQLVVSHFMFGPDWEEGCTSCSFWADGYNGMDVHLAARDTSFVVVSNAPLEKLQAYKDRLGWTFTWVSAEGSSFSEDYGVSFYKEADAYPNGYNYGGTPYGQEAPGLSTFLRLEDGTICHCYSTYARGLDIINSAYNILDMTPKGRDEDDLPFTMGWLRRNDQYA